MSHELFPVFFHHVGEVKLIGFRNGKRKIPPYITLGNNEMSD
jgi:hypothetical protein